MKYKPHPAWAKMRADHLAVYPECRACGSTDRIVVHHIRYRGPRGRSEKPGDLVTLCEQDHNDLHGKLGRTPPRAAQLEFITARATYARYLGPVH